MNQTIEKDEVEIKLNGATYLCHLEAEVEVDYTAGCSGSMRSGSSSYEDLAEPPSPPDIEVEWAESTLTIYNDHGEEIGTLVMKGVKHFNELFGELKQDDIKGCNIL